MTASLGAQPRRALRYSTRPLAGHAERHANLGGSGEHHRHARDQQRYPGAPRSCWGRGLAVQGDPPPLRRWRWWPVGGLAVVEGLDVGVGAVVKAVGVGVT